MARKRRARCGRLADAAGENLWISDELADAAADIVGVTNPCDESDDARTVRCDADGLYRTAADAPARRKKADRPAHYQPGERQREDAQICLTCTLPVCHGDEGCFARRKKAVREAKNENDKNGDGTK